MSPKTKIKFSKGENRALRAAINSLKQSDSSGRFDYRNVKKNFGKYTTDRNAFAAGVWNRRKDWKQFTHMSKADKKAVIAWAKKHKGPNPRKTTNAVTAASKGATTQRAPKPCTGSTYQAWDNRDWQLIQGWNSCDTNTVKQAMDQCVPAAGAIAAIAAVIGKSGTVAVGNALIGLGCGAFRIYINYAQEASDLKAVVVNVFPRDGGKGSFSPTRYVKAYPQ